MKKQTAVEWLMEQMDYYFSQAQKEQTAHLFQQAKAMEKEQIIKAYYGQSFSESISNAEQYYNETYNTDTP